ncbi:MAG: type II secretion system protein [Nitrospirae bacterium]|nr:type II secretion system protein [Nitrospirota bacterium]
MNELSSYPKHTIRNSQRGFTLIEILASLAILSISLVVILQLFSINLKGITVSDGYVDTVMKAESVMRNILDDEKLEEKSWSETTEDGYGIDVSITETENERTENLMVKLMEIDLSIRWQEGMKERKLTLKTMKTVAK